MNKVVFEELSRALRSGPRSTFLRIIEDLWDERCMASS
jgi:hypothetical protein